MEGELIMKLSDIKNSHGGGGGGGSEIFTESSITLTGNITLTGHSENHIYKLDPNNVSNYEVTLPTGIDSGLSVIVMNESSNDYVPVVIKTGSESVLVHPNKNIMFFKTDSGYISTKIKAVGQNYFESKIKASNAGSSDFFGFSSGMSSDGNTCIIGASLEDSDLTDSGAAYIFTRSGSIWTEQQMIRASNKSAGDTFGWDCSISGDGNTCIVSAYYEDTGATNAGSAYIFTRSGSVWTEQQRIQGSNSGNSDFFGYSCSISGDGNTCIVGATREDTGGSDVGAAYIFTRSGSVWTEQQMIQASDKEGTDNFGISCSISDSGDTCIVGAYKEDTGGVSAGAAYIFTKSGSVWTEQQKIMASDKQSGDEFGFSCSISGDGNTCIVGAYKEATGGYSSGASYIFTRLGSVWTEQQKIQASDKESYSEFGKSCGISGDGNTCIVGARSASMNDGYPGSAYIFTRSGSTWSEQEKFMASDFENADEFGWSCSINSNGKIFIVGAKYEDTGGSNAGAAYIFSGLI